MKKLSLLLFVIPFLFSCGGGSSSGGSHEPLLNTCQTCTYGYQCESGRCVRFVSGLYRCVPQDAQPGYRCPGGVYKSQDGGSCSEGDSL